jgi:hypothetical protein
MRETRDPPEIRDTPVTPGTASTDGQEPPDIEAMEEHGERPEIEARQETRDSQECKEHRRTETAVAPVETVTTADPVTQGTPEAQDCQEVQELQVKEVLMEPQAKQVLMETPDILAGLDMLVAKEMEPTAAQELREKQESVESQVFRDQMDLMGRQVCPAEMATRATLETTETQEEACAARLETPAVLAPQE